MSVDIYRNESLIELGTYYADSETSAAVVQALREKWVVLRERDLAADSPVQILVGSNGDEGRVKVVELFRWRSLEHRAAAVLDERCRRVQSWIDALAPSGAGHESFTEAIRGFNRNFSSSGGIELLKAAWSCSLNVEGEPEDVPLAVENGVLLMHRSARADVDGDGKSELFLDVFMHAGEIDVDGFGRVRVSQNLDVPHDGIVKSNGENGTDLPGTAIWRAGWQLETPLGRIFTDPDTPLVFGPAIVAQFPPIGMHFDSPTGPVALIEAASGRQVGTLTVGELTALDIVATKDDDVFAEYPARTGEMLEVLKRYTNVAPRS